MKVMPTMVWALDEVAFMLVLATVLSTDVIKLFWEMQWLKVSCKSAKSQVAKEQAIRDDIL